ncbi:glycosyltransferase [Melioribacteraceae bacterium 4301-Me]|uniref:glycosyltransferase n=1 Tax=Pyranulibacter aquaticus TaxID=3163344 RepID=UPI0035980B58
MFRVLVLAYYFPPMGLSGVQRTLKFVKYMPYFNWQPVVVTAGNTAYFAHDMSLLKEIENSNIEIIRTEAFDVNSLLGLKYQTVNMPKEFLRKILSSISKAFFIPDNKKSWSKKAYELVRKKLSSEKFDILYVTIPPFSSFYYAAKLKDEFNIPLFVDYRDLWYENHFAFYPTPYHKWKHKQLEYFSLKHADKIIAVNRKIKEKLLMNYKFLSFDDIVIIPHGYDPEDFEKVEALPKNNSKMKLTYSGIFYEKITPVYFLRAFKKLSIENPEIAADIQLEFIGYLRNENKKLISDLGLTEYIFDYGYLEHVEAVKKIKSTDILWMMIGNMKNADTISTGKLFEYFGARKPILACVPDGAAKSALKEYGAAFITAPDDVDDIKNKILDIYSLYKSNKLPLPNEDFIEKHNRKKLTEELTKQFQFYLKEEN